MVAAAATLGFLFHSDASVDPPCASMFIEYTTIQCVVVRSLIRSSSAKTILPFVYGFLFLFLLAV